MSTSNERDERQPSTQDLTRRRLLQVAGSGALAIGGGGLLSACGGSSKSGTTAASTPAATTTAKASEITRGGTLTVGLIGAGSAETVNPLAEFGDPNHCRTTLLFDKLFVTDPKMAVVPSLAESAEASADGKTWTIRLRSGVTWHDGKPLTADDLVHTIGLWSDPKNIANGQMTGIVDFKQVAKRDDMTVDIPLVLAVGEFPSILTAPGTSIVQNGATAATLAKAPVGTGPFKFGSFTPGKSSTFAANPDYWQQDMPYVDEVVVDSSFADPTTLMNALLAGKVNVFPGVPYLAAKQQLDAGQVSILHTDAQYELPIYMRVDKGPFTDVRVRQAMRLIADRQALVDGAVAGLGSVGNDLLGRFNKYYAEDLKRDQDIEQAKSLLKQAGKEGATFTLQTSKVTPGFTESATLFAQQAKQAGITIKIDTVDPAAYFTGPGGYGTRAFGQSYYTALPSLTVLYLAAFWSKSPAKETYWGLQSPGGAEADKLLFEAISAVDETKAADLWREVQQKQFDEGGVLSWGDGQNIIAVAKDVNGLEPGRNVFDNFHLERGWIKS